ncbi:DUF971 domain-containing protein [uncultured Ferrovibrio sp.]|jgi:Uncharacterized protein conserved in bacteria|uniref:DUF971 domain-containing protein n=1 Tax=uncultured Ferrovibrio sp. TaxID=1576913 RepID=UPI0026325C57|nr:DUF971 domain-containing protein [uncultured Ferrovibrio sp.]
MSPYQQAGRPACTELRYKSAEKLLEVEFADGKKFSFTAEFLRVESPSAEVQGHGPNTKTLVPGRRHVGIIGIEPVGTYAVRLKFDDLHDSGIYSWEWFYDRGHDQQELWAAYLAGLEAKGLSRDPQR